MSIDFDTPCADRLQYFLDKRGMTSRQLSKMIWEDKTHRDIVKELKTKPDTRSSTLVKICRILDISIDSLFEKPINDKNNQPIVGNHNIVNSNYVNTDITTLKAENQALRLVLEEKNARINDLKKSNEELGKRLDVVLQLGLKSDNKD